MGVAKVVGRVNWMFSRETHARVRDNKSYEGEVGALRVGVMQVVLLGLRVLVVVRAGNTFVFFRDSRCDGEITCQV